MDDEKMKAEIDSGWRYFWDRRPGELPEVPMFPLLYDTFTLPHETMVSVDQIPGRRPDGRLR